MIIATDAQPKISAPSKMKGTCKTWSTNAIDHCPGSVDKSRPSGLVEACETCYADDGFYLMPGTRNVRFHNAQDWKNEDWVEAMVKLIGRSAHFRFFDSGDCYHLGLAQKIFEVCAACPDTKFWIPTRMHKFPKFAGIFRKLGNLPNVVVRFSSDSTAGKRINRKLSSTIVREAHQVRDAHLCPATVPGNKPNCKANNCTACWDKSVPVIAYNFH